ncbi:MAG: T9SS type A sorting domain-containing protein, partial [Chlorobi bacterium]|nr:T9SS type A sorting domain-containing protein [Chlorobiota bacterium]
GRLVRTLVRQELDPGRYQASFDAAGLSGGVYFYRLHAGSGLITRKMVVVR